MTPDTSSAPLTVIVCTLNEVLNLPDCLSSVGWAEQVIVVDGGSADSTAAVAETLGAEVVRHDWAGYSLQKNWALDTLPIRHEWVLFLDADERVSVELAREISAIVRGDVRSPAGYYVARRLIFMGRWLKRCFWYPDYNLRLFRRTAGRFESRLVHETVVVEGEVGYLANDLIHDDQRDLAAYISRLNRYSSLEAREIHHLRSGCRQSEFVPAWRGTWGQRRRALKERVWYRVPLRPLVRFVWKMVVRRGFLDGREGLIFTVLACINDWQADAKVHELTVRQRLGLPGPTVMPELSSTTAGVLHAGRAHDSHVRAGAGVRQ
jgi:glycosyltransferase involved in cell wall biosynthesis